MSKLWLAMILISGFLLCCGIVSFSLTVWFLSQSWPSLVWANLNPNQLSFYSWLQMRFEWEHHKACFFVRMSENLTHKPGKQRPETNYINKFTQIPGSGLTTVQYVRLLTQGAPTFPHSLILCCLSREIVKQSFESKKAVFFKHGGLLIHLHEWRLNGRKTGDIMLAFRQDEKLCQPSKCSEGVSQWALSSSGCRDLSQAGGQDWLQG